MMTCQSSLFNSVFYMQIEGSICLALKTVFLFYGFYFQADNPHKFFQFLFSHNGLQNTNVPKLAVNKIQIHLFKQNS